MQAHKEHGNKWAVIARLLQGRRVRGGAALPHTARLTPASDRLVAALPSTDNAIKNHWNSTLKRRGGPDGAAGGSEEGEGSPAGAAPKSTPRAKRAPPAPRLPPPPPAPRARKRSRSRPSVADEAAGVLGALAGAPLPGRPLPLADRASVACLPAFFGAAADDEFALKPQQARAPAPAPAQPRAPQPPPASPRPSRLASAGKAGRGACAPSPSPSPRTGRGASERELTTVLAGEPGHDPTASFAFLRPGDVEMDSFGDEVLPAGLCALDALAGWA